MAICKNCVNEILNSAHYEYREDSKLLVATCWLSVVSGQSVSIVPRVGIMQGKASRKLQWTAIRCNFR